MAFSLHERIGSGPGCGCLSPSGIAAGILAAIIIAGGFWAYYNLGTPAPAPPTPEGTGAVINMLPMAKVAIGMAGNVIGNTLGLI